MLQPDDEALLVSALSPQLATLLHKADILYAQNRYTFNIFFAELTADEKTLVSAIDLEASEYNIADDIHKLIGQLYKRKWKMILNEVKEKLTHCNESSATEAIKPMLASIQELKEKLLQRGLL